MSSPAILSTPSAAPYAPHQTDPSILSTSDDETLVSFDPAPPHKCHEDMCRAWLVVLGGACNFFATFGLINTWGSFQAYYEGQGLHDASTIAWIGSIQYSSLFLSGIISGRLLDRGVYRVPLLAASLVLVAMTALTGSCTQYWHFVVVQGLGTGVSCGVIFGPTTAIVAQWFLERRALALGLVATGSSIGGVTLPIFFRYMIAHTGFAWTMRSIALIQLGALGISNLALRTRHVHKASTDSLFDFSVMKSAAFIFYFASAVFTFMGSTTLMAYLDVSAMARGVDTRVVPYLLSILNASSALGRISSGLLADRLGALNILIPSIAATGLITLVWPLSQSIGSFIAVAVCFGISCGAYMSLSSIPIIKLGDKDSLGRRIGVFQMAMMSSLVGSPVSGAIFDRTHHFQDVGVYAGSMLLFSVILMIVTRSLMAERVFCKI